MKKLSIALFFIIMVSTFTTPVSAADSERYLIVTPDGFADSLSALINLKTRQGYSVEVLPLSTAGNTPEAIRASILATAPSYVLLVGDVDNGSLTMPAFVGQRGQPTDLYYGVAGDGIEQTISVGRLPARSKSDLARMVWTLLYSRYPEKRLFHTVELSPDWEAFFVTQFFPVMDLLEGYTHATLCDDAAQKAVEAGEEIWAIGGHGVPYSMQCFTRARIERMQISSFVMPNGCSVGDYSYPVSYSEQLLLQGALGVVAASTENYLGYYEYFIQMFYTERLADGSQTVGQLVNYAKGELYKRLSPSGEEWIVWAAESYNLLGDPALRFGDYVEIPMFKQYLPVIVGE